MRAPSQPPELPADTCDLPHARGGSHSAYQCRRDARCRCDETVDGRRAQRALRFNLPRRSYGTEDDAAFRIDREEDHHADDGDDDRGYDQVDEVAHTTLM